MGTGQPHQQPRVPIPLYLICPAESPITEQKHSGSPFRSGSVLYSLLRCYGDWTLVVPCWFLPLCCLSVQFFLDAAEVLMQLFCHSEQKEIRASALGGQSYYDYSKLIFPIIKSEQTTGFQSTESPSPH